MTVCYWCGAKDTLADIGKELDDGKYKMVQCSKCKNAYYVVNKEKMNKAKQQTNEEYLKSCNTEQLAEFIIKAMIFYDNAGITVLKAIKNAVKDNGNLNMYFIENVVEWLKQPHRDTK